jgi:hypothetical protein
MNKEFVKYEQSLVLKELGFNEPCILLYRGLDTQPVCQMGYGFKTEKNSDYNDETNYWLTVPTYSQALRWFREKYNLIAYPVWGIDNTWDMNIQKLDNYGLLSGQSTLAIIKKPTYEEAESACLDKLIEICKNK